MLKGDNIHIGAHKLDISTSRQIVSTHWTVYTHFVSKTKKIYIYIYTIHTVSISIQEVYVCNIDNVYIMVMLKEKINKAS